MQARISNFIISCAPAFYMFPVSTLLRYQLHSPPQKHPVFHRPVNRRDPNPHINLRLIMSQKSGPPCLSIPLIRSFPILCAATRFLIPRHSRPLFRDSPITSSSPSPPSYDPSPKLRRHHSRHIPHQRMIPQTLHNIPLQKESQSPGSPAPRTIKPGKRAKQAGTSLPKILF